MSVSDTPNMITLRAEVAKREEDLRIARKHEHEAAERSYSFENQRAWIGAKNWTDECSWQLQQARAALIQATWDERKAAV